MSKRVLLLGGHGKVSLYMTPLIVSRSWHLTSVIRNPEQKATIESAGKKGPGKIDVLISSLDDIKSESDAKKIIDQAKPDYVVWSAGAGGKGGKERTYAIDRDSAIAFIRASIATPSVRKFLIVSALSERRQRAPWWDDETWAAVQKTNAQVLPDYFKAKLAADDVLTVLGEERRAQDPAFSYVCLRPGALLDGEATGKVTIGQTAGLSGTGVQRADVADVAVRLLESEGANGWFDLLNGENEAAAEVERVIQEGVNSIEGESLEQMKSAIAERSSN
ncbi:MAG: hypothetical protein M1818_000334 [Claussenomyces sp. TS43310]|nr:MAG: hypothetical protein M1818_000334 [Claussenomyces sp. TS43310]